MRVLNKLDLLEVSLKSLIADYDHETIINLYQPIIGYSSVALYFTLVFEGKNQKEYSFIRHEELLLKTKMSPSQFEEAKKYLEAVGLLKTYLIKQKGASIYHYDIFAPRTPNQFFGNALLYGMLIKCIGNEISSKLKALYPANKNNFYGEDISAKFTDVFHPDFEDESFTKAMKDEANVKGRNVSKIKGKFSYEIFFAKLEEISQIKSESIEEKEMKEIYRLATLYGIDETCAANYVANVYDPKKEKGKHIDLLNLASMFQKEVDFSFRNLKVVPHTPNLINSDSDLASKINMMEKVSPKEFLKALQNGTTPAQPDLRLINDLSKNFKLNNAVINALIDYVLISCDNILSRSYAEKIAASLAREGITTTIDAMNYLLRSSKQNKKVIDSESDESKKEEKNEKSNDAEENELTWEELLEEFEKGGPNGKA